jgi:hypothetical protein
MISSLAFAASRDVVSGIGTLSETRMPVSVSVEGCTGGVSSVVAAECSYPALNRETA